ncbi:hypothetical protein [Roseovarius aestuariivivens]|uniref:hypothetical protein n=1 Tax=Roseovarius aestuariivivens TaxID=1888910 RepID=UPI001436C7D9|nr:hypothetical protein [Roseovarius aestuariivivens]
MDDDKDDIKLHEEKHAPLLEALDPNPSPTFQKAFENDQSVVWITDQSEPWLRKEVRLRAELFQREFNYNHVQWEYDGCPERKGLGFLFHDQSFRIIGACVFRPIWQGYQSKGRSEKMRMDWLWICTRSRRSGVLARQWGLFRERFGVFALEHPLSDEMLSFLKTYYPDHEVAYRGRTIPVYKSEQLDELSRLERHDLSQYIPGWGQSFN